MKEIVITSSALGFSAAAERIATQRGVSITIEKFGLFSRQATVYGDAIAINLFIEDLFDEKSFKLVATKEI